MHAQFVPQRADKVSRSVPTRSITVAPQCPALGFGYDRQMRNDLVCAVRGLLRNPGFALAAVLTLALGIGAVTSIFSVADAVLLRPLPYPEQARLVMVWDQLTNLGVDRLGLYGEIFHEYSGQSQIFEETAAFAPAERNLVGAGDPERVSTIAATASLLPMLGESPGVGRGF